MARCYSEAVSKRHPSVTSRFQFRPRFQSRAGPQSWPRLWLLSDARNDATLEQALRRLPQGSGFVFRHYHLPMAERRVRFRMLARLCRARGIVLALAGTAGEARRWGADIAYGRGEGLGTAHSLRELRKAMGRARAVMLSPVHATRTHPGAKTLGPVRFLLLAKASPVPVIALGGMTKQRAFAFSQCRQVYGWAAIDGLSFT